MNDSDTKILSRPNNMTLPPLLLAHIFQLLDDSRSLGAALRTCKFWKQIFTPSFWERMARKFLEEGQRLPEFVPSARDWCWFVRSKLSLSSKNNKAENIKNINGVCSIEFPDGNYCQGDFVNGKPSGLGTFYYNTLGNLYEGEFRDGLETGKAVFFWRSGNRYIGDFENSFQTGKGTFYWANGDRYEGDYIRDRRTGFGTYYWALGDVYTGQFLDDKETGRGVYMWSNGLRYEGDYVEGKRTGFGTFQWTSGNRYEGEFRNNWRTGKGIYIWVNGDRYEGDFLNDKRTGKGTFYWANGDRYEGDFLDDMRTGHGVFTWSNGDRFEGRYLNNQRVEGVFTPFVQRRRLSSTPSELAKTFDKGEEMEEAEEEAMKDEDHLSPQPQPPHEERMEEVGQ